MALPDAKDGVWFIVYIALLFLENAVAGDGTPLSSRPLLFEDHQDALTAISPLTRLAQHRDFCFALKAPAVIPALTTLDMAT